MGFLAQEYCFDVFVRGCRLVSTTVRSGNVLIPSHVGKWLRVCSNAGLLLSPFTVSAKCSLQDLDICEAAYPSVLAHLISRGKDKAATISVMTKVLLDEHIPPMGLPPQVEATLREALENTTREVLLEVSHILSPILISNGACFVLLWLKHLTTVCNL